MKRIVCTLLALLFVFSSATAFAAPASPSATQAMSYKPYKVINVDADGNETDGKIIFELVTPKLDGEKDQSKAEAAFEKLLVEKEELKDLVIEDVISEEDLKDLAEELKGEEAEADAEEIKWDDFTMAELWSLVMVDKDVEISAMKAYFELAVDYDEEELPLVGLLAFEEDGELNWEIVELETEDGDLIMDFTFEQVEQLSKVDNAIFMMLQGTEETK